MVNNRCSVCKAGFLLSADSTACNACPTGQYLVVDVCTLCQAGYKCTVSSSSGNVRTKCLAGTFQNLAGQAECKPCPAGSYCDLDGMTAPKPCPNGK